MMMDQHNRKCHELGLPILLVFFGLLCGHTTLANFQTRHDWPRFSLEADHPSESYQNVVSASGVSRDGIIHRLWKEGSLRISVPDESINTEEDNFFWLTLPSTEPSNTFGSSSSSSKCANVPQSLEHNMEMLARRILQFLSETVESHEHDKITPVQLEMLPTRTSTSRARLLQNVAGNTESLQWCHESPQQWTTRTHAWNVEQVSFVENTSPVLPGWSLSVVAPLVPTRDGRRVVSIVLDKQAHLHPNRMRSEDDIVKPMAVQIESQELWYYCQSYRFIDLPEIAIVADHDTISKSTDSPDVEKHTPASSEEPFCMGGMSMVMYMRGFHRSFNTNDMKPCLNYYFRTWTLADKGKFKGAMVYSFLLGILTQGLTVIRGSIQRNVSNATFRKSTLVIVYVLQQLMGYVLMLIAMMYSVELLLSVVVGVACGHALFAYDDDGGKKKINPHYQRGGERKPLLTDVATSTIV